MEKRAEEKKPKQEKEKPSEKFKETRKYESKIDFLQFRGGNLVIKRG